MSLAQETSVLNELVKTAPSLWGFTKACQIDLINVSENFTYKIQSAAGEQAILRVHREGYHSHTEILSELCWSENLCKNAPVNVPVAKPGLDGQLVQVLNAPDRSFQRYMVLFEFVEGQEPDANRGLELQFEHLGEIAAACHLHVLDWKRPSWFERPNWDLDAVFGVNAVWGNWRDAPNVTSQIKVLLEQVEAKVVSELTAYGRLPDRFNLIHADMRLANLLVDDETIWVIDFDDCGHSWFMYDFAAAISFFEDDPSIPALLQSWLRGYQKLRPLQKEDIKIIPSLIMLRRLALLAWVGSHIEAPEPQALAPDFAKNTSVLGETYLASFSA